MKLTNPDAIAALYNAVQEPGVEQPIGERDGLYFYIIDLGNGPMFVVRENGTVLSVQRITISATNLPDSE